jgi:putative tryptophan/tyrosine transport system substrate-binding protein
VCAQHGERVRRIGVFMSLAADDPEGQARIGAFLQGLQERGWAVGNIVRIDYRWGGGDTDSYRTYARELVALGPEVILATGATVVGPLLQVTRTVPLVFAQVNDPVGAGFVANLAKPGGNATGFTVFEYSISGKWLELLKQIMPGLKQAGVLRDPSEAGGIGQFGAIQALAPLIGVELRPVDVRGPGEIERGIATFAREPNGGVIVLAGNSSAVHRQHIIKAAISHRLPAVYPFRYFAAAGGLISYGPDNLDQYRRAAGYVDRILKGEKPADLPVQAPTKHEMVINLKTAKALSLDVPPTLLARADEVIE